MRYAESVLEERIVAGEYIKLAAERMIRDFREPHLRWDDASAQTAYAFCRDMCVVHNPITGKQVPFELLGWQKFCWGNMYAWKIKDESLDRLERMTGSRRFRTAYIETGKGSGKSPLGATACLRALFGDQEPVPEIYICARAEHQALIPWRDIAKMVRANPELAPPHGICEIFGGSKDGRITCELSGGFIRTVANHSDGSGVSGPRPHLSLIEEYHEHLTDLMKEMLDDGKKGRKHPMTLIITNAGGARMGPCWEEHHRAVQILREVLEGDDYFAAIYAIDKGDVADWMETPEIWPKANPSLGHVIQNSYIIGQITKAKHSRSKLNHVLRMNMAVWPDAGGDWLDWDQWERAEVPLLDDAILDECDLYVTFDLADKRDLTAMTYNWLHRETKHLYQRTRFFTPADTLPERAKTSNSYLEDWARKRPGAEREGQVGIPTKDKARTFIETCPGQILDYIVPARRLKEAHERWGVVCVAFDRHHFGQFCVAMDRIGLEYWTASPDPDSPSKRDRQWKALGSKPGIALVAHPQGFEWSGPVAKAGLVFPASLVKWEDRILAPDPTVSIEINPTLRWNLTCAVVTRNPQGFRKFDKDKADKRYNQGKIDGLISGTMGAGIVDFEFPRPKGLAGLYANPAMQAWMKKDLFGTDV